MIPIERQLQKMLSDFPNWTSIRLDSSTVVWTGYLAPNKRNYKIQINLTIPICLENRSLLWVQPLVKVLSPQLREIRGNKEGSLPHVYWKHPRDSDGPFLCLFDAEHRQWTLCDYIANTTVPWTSFWLDFYEGWLVTGIWFGPGRHLETQHLASEVADGQGTKIAIRRDSLQSARANWLGTARIPNSVN